MRVLIIGGGSAGVSTATRLRRLDENAEIVIFEKTNEFAVSNCGLTYLLSGVVEEALNLVGTDVESMNDMYNIEVRLNHEVTAINRKDKTISIEGKADEPYDKLVIAIGAYQLRPDIDGVLAENIFTIRNIETIQKIQNYISEMDVKNILIIGGGLIGLEAAEAFVKLKLKTTIIEASSHLMPALDNDMAAILHNYVRERGINLYLNDKVTAFGEKVAVLASSYKVPYDMALIATGVKPDLKLSVLAELEIGESGGLKVDEYMRTSDSDIYAAGDDVEVVNLITSKPQRISHAGMAIKQARVIADHLGGLKSKFGPVIGSAILKFFDLTIAAIGANEAMLEKSNIAYKKVHLYANSNSGYYPGSEPMLLKIIFDKEGTILGSQGIGKDGIDKRMDILLSYMSKKGNVADLDGAEISYAPPFSTGKDAINNLGSTAEAVLNGSEKPIFYDDVDWLNWNDEVTLIDVRPAAQFKTGHIEKAVNIPLEAIRSNLDTIPHDKQVILYCNRGYKAYLASCLLNNHGFDNVYVLSGGQNLYNEILEDAMSRTQSYERIVNL